VLWCAVGCVLDVEGWTGGERDERVDDGEVDVGAWSGV
jgi:hypothetical protein